MLGKRRYPILVEKRQVRTPTDLTAAQYAQPWEVTLALRERGWTPYRVWFDIKAGAWIARVIDWGRAA
jgi:hypothetical protein